MRKTLLIYGGILCLFIVIMTSMLTKCNAQDSFIKGIPNDKAVHCWYGFMTAGVSSILYENFRQTRRQTKLTVFTKRVMIATGSSLFIGLAKEVYDARKGGSGFDVADLGATVLGSLPVTIVIKLTSKKSEQRCKKYY